MQVFGLQRISNAFKPFTPLLRFLWGIWNLVTAIFSAIGFVVVLPTFIDTLLNFNATCNPKAVPMDNIVGESAVG